VNDVTLSEVAASGLAHRRIRVLKDRLFGWTMAVGGITVIAALLTIFLYLVWVVFPLFLPAKLAPLSAPESLGPNVVHLSLEENADLMFVVNGDGSYRFLDAADGKDRGHGALLPAGSSLVSGLSGYNKHGVVGFATTDGHFKVVKPVYRSTFRNNVRGVDPALEFPAGEDLITVFEDGSTPVAATAAGNGTVTTIAAANEQGQMVLAHVAPGEGLALDADSVSLETTLTPIKRETAGKVSHLLMDDDQQRLFAVSPDGQVEFFDIRDASNPRHVETLKVVPDGVTLTDARLLAGGSSLLVGDSTGRVTQWFPVRDGNNKLHLAHIREFTALKAPITRIEPEYFRKVFAAIDADGHVGLFHTTAERTLADLPTDLKQATKLAFSPRAEGLVALDASGAIHRWAASNHHPEVSWHALWEKVWYEGREQPEYLWQSSSASNDFEPKFSLTPLVFGTVKAAFYALLFAIPLAIAGAVYTAFFMNPKLRTVVKPSIEIMAALPTVIIGFLAGLWLSPLIESHLFGVLATFFIMPLAVVVASWLWALMPQVLRDRIPLGSEILLIVPLVCLVIWLAMAASQPLEQLWFDGNLPRWLTQHYGITYDQRNSLVVGIAMGFAVIPNIFTISEDAIYAVPNQLATGSLALGATPWQTVSRIILLTASPGIFSGIMIGLGRAVGETMIVLMSTGNTPIMDFSLFQGFRALSANIAVEMPESEVNGTHYRVLFLAALVLFLTTFIFNTIAELVRQRLRERYSNL
jgi:phosphate transport system permease protein